MRLTHWHPRAQTPILRLSFPDILTVIAVGVWRATPCKTKRDTWCLEILQLYGPARSYASLTFLLQLHSVVWRHGPPPQVSPFTTAGIGGVMVVLVSGREVMSNTGYRYGVKLAHSYDDTFIGILLKGNVDSNVCFLKATERFSYSYITEISFGKFIPFFNHKRYVPSFTCYYVYNLKILPLRTHR